MASNIVFNGVTYSIPVVADDNWGPDLTAYFISIASNALQKTGGSFVLTSEVNFGGTFGLKTSYIKSQATNPSGVGAIRLGNNESVAWRNAANSADLSLTVNPSDELNFNGTALSVGGVPVQTEITVSDTATIDLALSVANDITASIVPLSIDNALISASAAIALTKLATVVASRALVSDGSGNISVSSVTATELDYVSGVTSAIQTQLGTKITNPMTTGGDLIYGGASGLPTRLPNGSAGQLLRSAGGTAAPTWSTAAYPDTTTANQFLYSSASNTVAGLSSANTAALITNSSGVPSFTTGAVANRVLRTDGTNITFSVVGLSTDVAGVLPIANGGTNNGSLAVTAGGALYTDGTRVVNVGAGTSGHYLKSNGAGAPTWAAVSASPTPPTVQRFTSGSGTYTTPANVQYIMVKMCGAGGGGGGSGTGAGAGGTGGNTTFGTSLLTANGGAGGVGVAGNGGSGGTVTINIPAVAVVSLPGGIGSSGQSVLSGTSPGGSNPFGGQGQGRGQSTNDGAPGLANTGGGASGGNTSASQTQGGGGGAGGYIEAIIGAPSATYSYAIGVGGTAGSSGTSGSLGGIGGSGVIIVTEYY